MSAAASLFRKLDGRLNPIVVKELRQAVRTRFVVAALLLFLVIQLVIIWLYLMMNENIASDFDGGRRIFAALQGVLSATCIIFIPIYTGIRFALERSGNSMDLFFVTTIRPRTIIWGKVLAAAILAVLLYSACMPFMTFTYLLRGIDLPSIFRSLASSFLVVLAAVHFAILAGSLAASIAMKILLAFVGLIVIVQFLWGALYYSLAVAVWRTRPFSSGGSFWALTWLTSSFFVAGMGLFHALSTAVISPTMSNRTFPVRVYLTLAWLVYGAVCFLFGDVSAGFPGVRPWAYTATLLFSLGLWIAVSEREIPSARVARRIPRNRFLRGVTFLFYTGAAGGVLWSVLMIALTLGVATACANLFPPSTATGFTSPDPYAFVKRIEIMGGMGLYAYCYAISAVHIRRRFLSPKVRYSQTWMVALCLFALGAFFPLLIAYIASPARFDYIIDTLGVWTAANPFMLGNDLTRPTRLTFVAVWAIVVTLLALPWFVRQVKHFRRPERPAEAEGDKNPRGRIQNTGTANEDRGEANG
jgi:hypothetical protein